MQTETKGKMFGVALRQRAPNDPAMMFHILVEDDEHWSETSASGNAYWLDDLIEQLVLAKEILNAECKMYRWGYLAKEAK